MHLFGIDIEKITIKTHKHTRALRVNTYFSMIIIKIAGIVDISIQMQPQTHIMNASVDRIGDSHSKQLLFGGKTKK